MRSSLFFVSSLVALAAIVGCSTETFVTPTDGTPTPNPVSGGGGADGGTDSADAAPSPVDAAVPPGCDAKKLPSEDACVITEASGIFVSPSGSAAGDGSRAKPLASLNAAIALAKTAKRRVYACEGTYAESVVLADGVSLFGGFDCSAWTWSATAHAKVAAPTSPALRADAIASDTRVDGFDVVAPAGTANAPSSIGFIATSSPGVRFVRGSITAGAGFAGAPGTDAVQLTNGPQANGEDNLPDATCTGPLASLCMSWHASRAGGFNACVGKNGYNTGAGGDGGDGGVFLRGGLSFNVISAPKAGGPVSPSAATAAGGNGSTFAQAGAAGAAGVSGANGAALGAFGAQGYQPSDGAPGTDGVAGQGGGGGAGMGVMQARFNSYAANATVYGVPGTGGGAGGCPGLAGQAGKGGGASVAVVAIDSPMTFDGVELVSATGGDGGAAGVSTAGTLGGKGGVETTGYQYGWGYYLGANGGSGGNAGLSGQGGGGPSVGYAFHGTAPTLLATTVKNGAGGKGAPAKAAPAGLIPASPDGFSGKSTTF